MANTQQFCSKRSRVLQWCCASQTAGVHPRPQPYIALVCCLVVSSPVTHITKWITGARCVLVWTLKFCTVVWFRDKTSKRPYLVVYIYTVSQKTSPLYLVPFYVSNNSVKSELILKISVYRLLGKLHVRKFELDHLT